MHELQTCWQEQAAGLVGVTKVSAQMLEGLHRQLAVTCSHHSCMLGLLHITICVQSVLYLVTVTAS